MEALSNGKIDDDGIISSDEKITEKEGYEAMLYMLKAYYDATESTDLTDILSGEDIGANLENQQILHIGNIGSRLYNGLEMKVHHYKFTDVADSIFYQI